MPEIASALGKFIAPIAAAVAPAIAAAVADKFAEKLPDIAERVTDAVLDRVGDKLPDFSQLDEAVKSLIELPARVVDELIDRLPFPFNHN
ncbi:hypothetical protein SEA_NERGAL_3 [Mycobacterium Phage Nergal]|nr:hypothetical protein SEA_NERGAL_3 [Mycobacterium Phage Nergal]